jgi:hydrogenase expression/formation protein HypD
MRFIDEYRDPRAAIQLAAEIKRAVTRSWTIMEICGGQTHAIVKHGLDLLLPDKITLLHGPGCPVCVTPVELIDKAIAISLRKGVILCSFGDMLRVPGTEKDLLMARAEGGDIRTVYSPLDALQLARENPSREVVFFAIGFETTAPANAAAVYQARREGLDNLYFLVAQVLVPPAIESILSSPGCQVQGFLAAGHVCTVMGYREYESLAEKYGVPMVVTGFEPLDILHGIHLAVLQLERGRAVVENQYSRVVCRDGNPEAQRMINEVFRVVPRKWRGIGAISDSGLALNETYHECISGQILQGRMKPQECTAFGGGCTPEHPLGATMVSSEGACAAYYRYRSNAEHSADKIRER